jgi:hypothetical protein
MPFNLMFLYKKTETQINAITIEYIKNIPSKTKFGLIPPKRKRFEIADISETNNPQPKIHIQAGNNSFNKTFIFNILT